MATQLANAPTRNVAFGMRTFAARAEDPRKLGKRHPKHDPRTLQLAAYLRPKALPPAPVSSDYYSAVTSWGMMLNDKIGDCTCAAAGHMIEAWTQYATGTEVVPTNDQIESAYEAVSGYDPSTGAHDDGAVELDVLNYWQSKGIAGRTIAAFAALEPKNQEQVRDAVYLFGGCYIGLALPVSAQNQTVWSVPPGGPIGDGAPGSWGGHAVPILGYTARDLTVITWGAPLSMTWQFLDAYCDEAYAVLSQDFINKVKETNPNGFDFETLENDLHTLGST